MCYKKGNSLCYIAINYLLSEDIASATLLDSINHLCQKRNSLCYVVNPESVYYWYVCMNRVLKCLQLPNRLAFAIMNVHSAISGHSCSRASHTPCVNYSRTTHFISGM